MWARLSTLRLMAVPPLALFLVTLALIRLGTWLPGPTFDDELFAVEAHFGYPAFAVAAWVIRRPLLHELSMAVYIHLPLVATLVYARVSDSREASRRYLAALILIVVVGGLSYRLVPGAGTIATFHEAFPCILRRRYR